MRIFFFAIFSLLCVNNLAAKIYPQKPEKNFVVVLDAGHGGKDPGAVGSSEAKREKDINLAITLEVGRLLQNNHRDIKVVYTRQTDVFLELGQRANIAKMSRKRRKVYRLIPSTSLMPPQILKLRKEKILL